MTHLLRSFDVFDTLLARRCIEPALLFAKLEQAAGLIGLAAVVDRLVSESDRSGSGGA